MIKINQYTFVIQNTLSLVVIFLRTPSVYVKHLVVDEFVYEMECFVENLYSITIIIAAAGNRKVEKDERPG